MSSESRASTSADGFTPEERAAMKERAAELRAQAKREKGAAKAAAELQDVLDAIAKLPDDADRALAERLHVVITEAAPQLAPRTWYGMPAYALDGKVLCFVQPASKFDTRYTTLGFNDTAKLDDGAMWPASFAITSLGPAEQKAITELVQRAIG
ncbi:MAG: DUF1801 domain-containing protein [Microcella pacifica]|uniref:iron chaperone n=1 Tax=Microcella pacifica TaxID=2591847 RepID=UPI00331585B1